MGECGTEFALGECHGEHLGKFSSCLDEALWRMALESGDGNGDPDFGYAAPVRVAGGDPDSAESQPLEDESPGSPVVVVPGGFYVVYTMTTGQVAVVAYEDEDAAEEAWDVWSLGYEGWCATEGVDSE